MAYSGGCTPRDHLYTIEERDRYGRVVNKYLRGRLLGKGGFAKCYLVTDCSTNKGAAAKIIDKKSLTRPKTQQKLKSEIKIHASLKHRHLVEFQRYFEDDNYVYIILELCEGETLMEHSKRRKRFSEPETSYFMWQCLQGLKYMHRSAVIHRDLKLGNIMLTADLEVKIGDFGLAAQLDFDGQRKRTICGTPNYIAPEILEGSSNGHSFEVDIWSVGVIMYTLLVGHPPFETSDMKSTYRRIKEVRYSFPPGLQLSYEALDLIQRILQAIPERRPTLEDLERDAFFTVFPPSAIAPLSLFTKGTSEYITQQQRHEKLGPRGAVAEDYLALTRTAPSRSQPPPYSDRGRVPLSRLDPNLGYAVQHTPQASVPRMVSSAGRFHTPSRSSSISRGIGSERHPHYGSARSSSVGGSAHREFRETVREYPPSVCAPVSHPVRGVYDAYSPSPRTGASRGSAPPSHPETTPAPSEREASPMRRGEHHTPGSGSAAVPPPVLQGSPAHTRSPSSSSPPSSYTQRFTPSLVSPPPYQYTSTRSASAAPQWVERTPLTARGESRSPSYAAPSTDIDREAPRPMYGSRGADTHPADPSPCSPTTPWEDASPYQRAASEVPPPRHHDPAKDEDEDPDERQNLTMMQNNLERTFNRGAGISEPEPEPQPVSGYSPNVWVTMYSDFTAKYGMAYCLCNDQVGVHFNDSTKMVWDYPTGNVEYVAKGKNDQGEVCAEQKICCKIDDYPATLKKKITLIVYFRNYLLKAKGKTMKEGQQEVIVCSKAPSPTNADVPSENMVYVKRWLLTRLAVIFRLSNKSVQVSFFDGTELILSSEAKLVTYTDEGGSRTTFPLVSMMSHPRADISTRLKYTKDIICQLIGTKA